MIDKLLPRAMASTGIRSFLDALDEPAMVVKGGVVRFANAAARKLLGTTLEGNDVRLAIRHPQALEHILPGLAGDVDISGIGQIGRPWTLSIRQIEDHMLLIRLIDRSATVAAEKMRVDFVANASHELRTPLAAILGYSETLADETDLPPEHRLKFGSTIRVEARRMLRIIEEREALAEGDPRELAPRAWRRATDHDPSRARAQVAAGIAAIKDAVDINIACSLGMLSQEQVDETLRRMAKVVDDLAECTPPTRVAPSGDR